MSERIKELIKQVGTDVSGKWVGVANSEKLAELIVQECILTIQMGITRDGHNTEKYFRSIKHIKQIKEHFGVEEPKGWICPKCNADRTKIACPLGFGATVDGRCPMTVEAQ
jgi:hypothetical protein